MIKCDFATFSYSHTHAQYIEIRNGWHVCGWVMWNGLELVLQMSCSSCNPSEHRFQCDNGSCTNSCAFYFPIWNLNASIWYFGFVCQRHSIQSKNFVFIQVNFRSFKFEVPSSSVYMGCLKTTDNCKYT